MGKAMLLVITEIDQLSNEMDCFGRNLIVSKSNFLYVLENVIKCGGDFEAIFWKKPWAIVHAFFQNLLVFKKMLITLEFELGIGSNFLQSIRTSMCI